MGMKKVGCVKKSRVYEKKVGNFGQLAMANPVRRKDRKNVL